MSSGTSVSAGQRRNRREEGQALNNSEKGSSLTISRRKRLDGKEGGRGKIYRRKRGGDVKYLYQLGGALRHLVSIQEEKEERSP